MRHKTVRLDYATNHNNHSEDNIELSPRTFVWNVFQPTNRYEGDKNQLVASKLFMCFSCGFQVIPRNRMI